MFVEIIEGQSGTFKQRSARVRCETCQKERVVQYKTVHKKLEHACKSCIASKRQTGRVFSKEHCKAISKGLRVKGWRLHCGYKEIMVDTDHPRKRLVKKGKYTRVYPYVFEHHLVMEENIGRFLESHELVHHVDSDKLNNAISNLYLCTGSDATACRAEHNAAHKSLEDMGLELYKLGIIEFCDGRYRLSETGRKLLNLDSPVT